MGTDIIRKIKDDKPIRYGSASCATGGRIPVTYNSGAITYSGLDTTMETRLTDKFDDTNYYSN